MSHMNKIFSILLVFAIAAYAQQTTVAVLPSEGDSRSGAELEVLTDEMREAALKVLPTATFVLLKQDVVVKRLGGAENFIKECKESTCIVDLGKKAQVDYVAQATVIELDGIIRLKVELYSVSTEGLVGMFNDEAGSIRDLLAIVKNRAPAEVFSKIPGVIVEKAAPVEKKKRCDRKYNVNDDECVVNEPYEPPVRYEEYDDEDSDEKGEKSRVSFWIRAGINSSYTYAEHNSGASGDFGDIFGMQLGFALDFAVSDWFHIQPNLIYIQKGMKDNGTDFTSHYIELPLLLSIKSNTIPIRFSAGPYFGLCLDGYCDDYDFGLSAGVGFDIGMFYIGLLYDYGLVRHFEYKYMLYNRTLGLNVGVNL